MAPGAVVVTQARPLHASKNGQRKEKGKDHESDTYGRLQCI